jgi:hypothetical protein
VDKDERRRFRKRHLIPINIEYDFNAYESFFAGRQALIVEKLQSL